MDINYRIYGMGDFSCLPVISNGCADSIGYIADHIPRAGSITVVASVGGEVCGYVLATASNAGVYVHNVMTLEKYQRIGVATKMLEQIDEHIERTECRFPIMLHVMESNLGAVSCYRKAGFHVNVRIPNHPAIYENMLVMRKNRKREW
jgi:ribosomal protein S18 acetylase RimI-like enzyme